MTSAEYGSSAVARRDASHHGDRARAVADAVLHEGYVLYPYRASADRKSVV